MNSTARQKISLILGRRSIRAFRDHPVDDVSLQILLEAAMAAPSAAAKDPWRFIAIRQRETLSAIAEALPNGAMLASAAVGIVVCGDMEAAHDGQLSYLLQDCSAATQNILLAAHALGLGACWLGVHPREPRMAHISKLFALPISLVPVACIAIGWPAEEKAARTRFRPDYVRFEKWQH
jgi:nitroreductase